MVKVVAVESEEAEAKARPTRCEHFCTLSVFIENEVELAHSYFAWNAVADSKIESYKVSKVVFQSPMY